MVLDGQVGRPGWLETSGERILACGSGPPPRPADDDFPDCTVVPGFIDMHVHGGGGASYTDTDGISAAAEFHLRHGTTTTLASLVTSSPAELIEGVRALAAASQRGTIAGVHLEGPWLSPERCGAHDPARMRDPDPGEIDAVLAAGDGAIRMVTLAPELPGAEAAIRRFRDAGVVVGRWTYRRDLRADQTGHRCGRHGRHPPVQRDAPVAPPRARTGAGVAAGPGCDRRTHRRRRARAPRGRARGDTGRRARSGRRDHRRPGRGRPRRRGVSPWRSADRRRIRRGAGTRNVDDRRQHRHHGSGLPHLGVPRRRPRRRTGRRGADDGGDAGASPRARTRGRPVRGI